MWALFYHRERVSRLYRSERDVRRAARHSGLLGGERLLEDYEIKTV